MRINIDGILSRIEGAIIFSSYATLITLVGVETVRRMVTGDQAIWAPEIALYAFIWLSWFAMAEHIRNGTHLAFGSVRERLGPRPRAALELFDCLLWLMIGAVILYYSVATVSANIAMGQTIFGTNIPLAAASLAVPMGWSFSMLRVLQRIAITVRGEAYLTLDVPPVGGDDNPTGR